MKKVLLFFLGVFAISFLLAQPISVMTYNIRYDNPRDSLDAWQYRKNFLLNQIQFYEPDVMGVQEALTHQLTYLDKGLIAYDFKGVGRDDGKKQGEYTAIFYNKKKFQLLKEGTFWLSKTPDRVSMGWDAACNRTCTYLLLKHKKTKQKYWVFNTHFDHRGTTARTESAKLINAKIKQLNPNKFPVVLMGDFNIQPDNPTYKVLTKELSDVRLISKLKPFGNTGTFNGFRFHQPAKNQIDFIFVDTQQIEVLKCATLTDSKNCHFASDHFPVYAELRFKRNKKSKKGF